MARPQRTRCCCPWPPWPRRLAHGGRAPPRVAQRCSSWRRRPAPTPAPAALPPPHPLRAHSGLAPRPSLHGPAHHLCVTLAPPRTLPAPFLHPSLCRCRRARSRAQSMCRSVAPQASSLSLPPREKVLRLFFWVNGLDQITTVRAHSYVCGRRRGRVSYFTLPYSLVSIHSQSVSPRSHFDNI